MSTEEREPSPTVTSNNLRHIGKKSFAFIPSEDTTMDLLKSCIAESVAYFLLVICIFFSEGDATKFIYGFWCILMVFGNISGAHINPILTFSLWIYNGDLFIKKNLLKLGFYLLFQFIGAMLGTIFCWLVYSKAISYVTTPPYANIGSIFFVESFFSGTLAFMVLFICSPTTRPTEKNYVNVTLFSLWFMLIIQSGNSISGASYNPTFYLVLNGFARIFGKVEMAYSYLWIYILAPFIGAFIFTLLFKFIFKPFYASRNNKPVME